VDCDGCGNPLAATVAMGIPTGARFAAVIVAAGQGLRAGQPVPKQFANWRGKPVVRHSAEALIGAGAKPVVVAVASGAEAVAREALGGLDGIQLATGGATRQASVRAALETLTDSSPAYVLIHDAARPDCPAEVVERLLAALDVHPGAIPTLPVVDSLAMADGELMVESASREALRRFATPTSSMPIEIGPASLPQAMTHRWRAPLAYRSR